MARVLLLIGMTMMAAGPGRQAQVKPQMPADVGPGRVAWFDISASDLARAQEFYGALFDWKFNPVTGSDQAFEINSRGVGIGTLRRAEGALSAFNGVVYIQVDDVQRASDKAKTLGATIVEGFPFNLPNDIGAISLIIDPSGHPLGLYSRARLPSKAP